MNNPDLSNQPRPPLHSTQTIAGNFYDKYGSGNILIRWAMKKFLRKVRALQTRIQPCTIHDVGCGEGHLTALLAKDSNIPVRASDISPEIISIAESQNSSENTHFCVKDVYSLQAPEDAAELVVCSEVLEHLDNPAKAVQILAELAQPYLLVTVPYEPWWRMLNICRLAYLKEFGNTPGHVQHLTRSSFRKLLKTEFEVIDYGSSFPWLVALCRSRRHTEQDPTDEDAR